MSNFLKEEKRQQLIVAAHELFLDRGVVATTIGEIAARAKVAKGSFYLYFTDKQDIFHSVAEQYSRKLLTQAYHHAAAADCKDFSDRVITFADYIIGYFQQNHAALRMLDRKFGWPIVKEALRQKDDPLLQMIIRDIKDSPAFAGKSDTEITQTVFVIIEMVGATCYSCILKEQPTDMDTMKPVLFRLIRKLLEP